MDAHLAATYQRHPYCN